jgi:hypothetical protein
MLQVLNAVFNPDHRSGGERAAGAAAKGRAR